MDDLRKTLGELGLGRHEALVYATLLAHSPAGAAWVAKKCELSRSSVYTTLQSLADKGLVGTTYQNEVKQFVAEGHGALVDLLRNEQKRADERVALAEGLRERFEARAAGGLHVPQIVYFEGQQGLKRIFLAMLRDARPGAVMSILRDEFVWQPAWRFVFEPEWHERVRRLKAEKNLSTRLLVNRSRLERGRAAYYRARRALEHRVLPRGHAVDNFALYLVDDVASVLSIESNNLVGIKIVNRHLASNFARVYAALWGASSAR